MCDPTTLRGRAFDRLRRSIANEPSDGHAVFFYYTYPFFQQVTQVDLNDYFHNPKVMFDAQMDVLERLGQCGNLAPDEGAAAECSALGGTVRFDEHGFISVREAEIESLADVQKLQPGDPYGDNYMRRALETLEYMVKHAPEGIRVNPPVAIGPFTVAAQLRGISEFCMDLLLEPELAKALLDVCTETSIRYMKAAEAILGAPLHHILLCDDISSFLSPEQYREWVLPIYERIFREFSQTQRWLHNDADAAHLAPDIAAFGWDAWQYAPSIDPLFALEATGGSVTLLGGLDPLELQGITPDETYRLCTKRLASFQGNTRLVLGPGGSVNQVPVENLLAILRAAENFKINPVPCGRD